MNIEIINAFQELAAAQARYEIVADRLRRETTRYEIRPSTTEIEVAKERLYNLLKTP